MSSFNSSDPFPTYAFCHCNVLFLPSFRLSAGLPLAALLAIAPVASAYDPGEYAEIHVMGLTLHQNPGWVAVTVISSRAAIMYTAYTGSTISGILRQRQAITLQTVLRHICVRS